MHIGIPDDTNYLDSIPTNEPDIDEFVIIPTGIISNEPIQNDEAEIGQEPGFPFRYQSNLDIHFQCEPYRPTRCAISMVHRSSAGTGRPNQSPWA